MNHYVPRVLTDDDDQWNYPPFNTDNGRKGSSSNYGDNSHNKRTSDETDWERDYVVWFGPDVDSMPEIAKRENAMFLPWPRAIKKKEDKIVYGDLMPFPGEFPITNNRAR